MRSKTKIWNICILLLIANIIFFSILATSINVGTNVHFNPSSLNTEYITNATLSLTTIRVDSDALYFNDNILKHTPDAGSIKVYIESYNPPNYIKYKINTTGGTTEVNHTIGGLNNSELYSIHVDGSFWKSQSTNATGIIMFNHSASNHTFEITKSANVVVDGNIYNSNGVAVAYKWGNWTAQAGATNVDGGSSKTYIKATNNGSIAGDATISWSFAYFANGSNQIPFSLNGNPNIKYYWGTGNTPSAVATWDNSTDSDGTFIVSVPASSTLWVYYEIQQIPNVPAGEYTQTFTWTAT